MLLKKFIKVELFLGRHFSSTLSILLYLICDILRFLNLMYVKLVFILSDLSKVLYFYEFKRKFCVANILVDTQQETLYAQCLYLLPLVGYQYLFKIFGSLFLFPERVVGIRIYFAPFRAKFL